MSCENSLKTVDYLSDDEIVEFFSMINPGFCLENLPNYLRNSAAEIIACKTNTTWEKSNAVLYVDGTRENCISSPRVPIVSLSDISIIRKDESLLPLVLSGEDRQVEWACDTGVISLIKSVADDIETITDIDDWKSIGRFPVGLNNIKLTGVFGNLPLDLLKLLQLMLIGKSLQLLDSNTYGFNKISEKIGRYEYKLGAISKNSSVMSFDDYIGFLFNLLPQTEGLYIGSIGGVC